MTVTPSTSTGPNYGTEPFGEETTRHSLPTSAQAGRTNFRTSVIQLDRPGDPSVFSEQTYAEARELMARYPAGQARSALLPMLHLVQSVQGHVTADGIAFCAEQLDLTKAQVTAVATFYTMYKRAPTGEYLVSVCTNALCGMMGGDAIFAALKDSLGVGNNDTTADGAITLEHAECLAACDYAPVVTVNYEFFDNQSVESATQLVDQLRAGQRPAPTRGAPLCTFRPIERQIAGFFDDTGLAPDSTSSGVPTEVGVALALQRGDTAPSYATRSGRAAQPVTPPDAEQAPQTSAHDAPLETAQSDDAHEAKPPGGAA
jgi:NADH-quinone oxidoreductase subunit E